MIYFALRPVTKHKQKYIQVKSIATHDFNIVDFHKRIDYHQKISLPVNLPELILYPTVKWLDYINSGIFKYSSFIVISEYFLSIIKNYLTSSYQIFDIRVNLKGEVKTYKLLYFYFNPDECIDFNQSKFIFTSKNKNAFEIRKYKNYNELYQTLIHITIPPDFPELTYHQYFLKDGISLDIFNLHNPFNQIMVSERLKNIIQDHDISGLEFVSFEDIQTNPKYKAGYYSIKNDM